MLCLIDCSYYCSSLKCIVQILQCIELTAAHNKSPLYDTPKCKCVGIFVQVEVTAHLLQWFLQFFIVIIIIIMFLRIITLLFTEEAWGSTCLLLQLPPGAAVVQRQQCCSYKGQRPHELMLQLSITASQCPTLYNRQLWASSDLNIYK